MKFTDHKRLERDLTAERSSPEPLQPEEVPGYQDKWYVALRETFPDGLKGREEKNKLDELWEIDAKFRVPDQKIRQLARQIYAHQANQYSVWAWFDEYLQLHHTKNEYAWDLWAEAARFHAAYIISDKPISDRPPSGYSIGLGSDVVESKSLKEAWGRYYKLIMKSIYQEITEKLIQTRHVYWLYLYVRPYVPKHAC
eukprot:GHVU01144726.1.p1 GENE.GHVU01144726.1~~GHVU01144726.1.p1  ORF type:complete len:205 (-),score=20.05 GHVU01144726.1:184-774(-)